MRGQVMATIEMEADRRRGLRLPSAHCLLGCLQAVSANAHKFSCLCERKAECLSVLHRPDCPPQGYGLGGSPHMTSEWEG